MSRYVTQKGPDDITWFVDADGVADNAKVVTQWCTYFGDPGMFDWCSKQQTQSRSSWKSEVKASQAGTIDAVHKEQGSSAMGFTFTMPSPVCQDNGDAIAMFKLGKNYSRTRQIFKPVNVLMDAYDQICYNSWVCTKYMKGDLFNKVHQPANHQRLVIATCTEMSTGKVEMLQDKGDMFEVDGWLQRAMKEIAVAA